MRVTLPSSLFKNPVYDVSEERFNLIKEIAFGILAAAVFAAAFATHYQYSAYLLDPKVGGAIFLVSLIVAKVFYFVNLTESLERLNLETNWREKVKIDKPIDDRGVTALLGVLSNTPSLKTLSLTNRALSATQMGRLASEMPYLRDLTHLFLYHNALGDAGLEVVLQSLRCFPNLAHLDLTNNSIESVDILAIRRTLPHLKTLNLSENPLRVAPQKVNRLTIITTEGC